MLDVMFLAMLAFGPLKKFLMHRFPCAKFAEAEDKLPKQSTKADDKRGVSELRAAVGYILTPLVSYQVHYVLQNIYKYLQSLCGSKPKWQIPKNHSLIIIKGVDHHRFDSADFVKAAHNKSFLEKKC